MKVLHLNAGNETGGGMHHILALLKEYDRKEFVLGVLEKGELYERANAAGIQTIYFENQTRLSISLMYRIANYIKNEKITCLHTHGPRANVYGVFLKKIASFYWVLTVHSDPSHDFLGKGLLGAIFTKLNMGAIKQADRIIAISEPFKQNLIKLGICHNRIKTTLNGIDFHDLQDQFYTKEEYGIEKDAFLFLQVARLERVKGHQYAFYAFSEVLKKHSNCHLMLVGDGSLLSELQDLAVALNIKDRVHFLGHRDDVAYFYPMADITLLTSLSESFPLVLLESARVKTPVIASKVGGVAELIKDNSLGWTTKPGNVTQLIQTMEEALDYHERGVLSNIGDELYTHASTQFSVSTFAESIYDVYLDMEHIN